MRILPISAWSSNYSAANDPVYLNIDYRPLQLLGINWRYVKDFYCATDSNVTKETCKRTSVMKWPSSVSLGSHSSF